MKNLKYLPISFLVIIVATCTVKAQKRNSNLTKADSVNAKSMLVSLNLNEQQKMQLKFIMLNKQAEIDRMIIDSTLTFTKRAANIEKVIIERTSEIDAILTPVQKEQFKKHLPANLQRSFNNGVKIQTN